MSVIVFLGVFRHRQPRRHPDLAGTPDQIERERAIKALGPGSPESGSSISSSSPMPVRGDPRPLLRLQRAGAAPDLRAHAGDAGARRNGGADLAGGRHPARPLCGLEAARAPRRKASWPDRSSASACRLFWQGLMLIMVFAVMLGWLPSTGRGQGRLLPRHQVEPVSPATAWPT